MKSFSILTVFCIIFTVFDTYAYVLVRFQERTSRWWYKLPGGGFVALWRHGSDTGEGRVMTPKQSGELLTLLGLAFFSVAFGYWQGSWAAGIAAFFGGLLWVGARGD